MFDAAFASIRREYRHVPSSDDLGDNLKLPLSDDDRPNAPPYRQPWWSTMQRAVAVMLLGGLLLGAGFVLGRSTTTIPRGFAPGNGFAAGGRAVLSANTELRSFVYNRTFADPPSAETDAAWGTIFPPHAGFFHDADIAPAGGSLAAYHQLHCLDGIRHAYWILHAAVESGESVDFDALPDHHTPWHTRHCIDFLRQMLMCNADLTIEYVNPGLKGIVGFGVDHQCARWDAVMQWTVDRQEAWARSHPGPR